MPVIVPKEITDIHKEVLKVGTKIEHHKKELEQLKGLYKELESRRRKAIDKYREAIQIRMFNQNRARPVE